jgi:5-methylcytosine-specific restriction enzyme subunit McrC
MHALCRLLLEHVGPGVAAGGYDFIPFTLYMPGLFEMFIARWLAANLPSNIGVETQYSATLDSNAQLKLRIDIVLQDVESGKNLAVLDTKYKGAEVPEMSDIQQVAFYANELGVEAAILIYPSAMPPYWVRNGDVLISTIVFDIQLSIEQAGRAFLRHLDQNLFRIAGRSLLRQ